MGREHVGSSYVGRETHPRRGRSPPGAWAPTRCRDSPGARPTLQSATRTAPEGRCGTVGAALSHRTRPWHRPGPAVASRFLHGRRRGPLLASWRELAHGAVTAAPSSASTAERGGRSAAVLPQKECSGRPGTQKKPRRLLQGQLKAGRDCPAGPAPLGPKQGDATCWALPQTHVQAPPPRAPVLRAALSTWLGSNATSSGTCPVAARTTATLLREGPVPCRAGPGRAEHQVRGRLCPEEPRLRFAWPADGKRGAGDKRLSTPRAVRPPQGVSPGPGSS